MKAFISIFATLTTTVVLSLQAHAQSFLTNELVAYYPFNGNANDASGNGNDGTAIDGVSYIPDFWSLVASFNGNGQYISLPGTISNYEDLTVSFWTKTSDSNSNAWNNSLFLVSRDIPGATYDWNICMGQGMKIQFHTGTPTNDNLVLVSDDIPSNQWVQVVCVADSSSGTKTIYLNGSPDTSVGYPPSPFVNNGVSINVAAVTVDPSKRPYFSGEMANLRFYNRALSSNEVAQLYAFESAPLPTIQNWQLVLTNNSFNLIQATSGTLFLPTLGEIYRSTNSGASWDDTSGPPIEPSENSDQDTYLPGGIAASNQIMINTHQYEQDGDYEGGVWATTNDGASWDNIGIANSFPVTCVDLAYNGQTIAGCFQGASFQTGVFLFGGGWGRVYADQWGDSESGAPENVTALPNGYFYVEMNDSGDVVSKDNGQTWTLASSIQGKPCYLTNTNLLLIAENGEVWTSSDLGTNWSDLTNITNGISNVYKPLSLNSQSAIVTVLPYQYTYITTNSGNSWSLLWTNGGYFTLTGNTLWAGTPTGLYKIPLSQVFSPPINSYAVYGQTDTLSVPVSSTTPVSYQWYFVPANNSGQAGAYAETIDEFVYGVVVTNGGYGYGNVPNINIVGGDGSGAIAFATVSNGMVTDITVTNAGYGYTTVPEVVIDPPNGILFGQTNSTLTISNVNQNSLGDYYVVVTNSFGSITSSVINITILYPPSISTEPQDQVADAYGTALFGVSVTGTTPLSYQWLFQGTNLPNSDGGTLMITNVTPGSLGQYFVIVSNEYGSVTSSIANLFMYPFLNSPFSGAITYWGQTNVLGVETWGSGDLTYQWYFNGAAISGATSSNLVLSPIQFTNAGLYSVVVSSPYGSVTNTPEQVVVNPADVSLALRADVVIQGTVGYNYAIQSTTNLSDTNSWITETNIILTKPTQDWDDNRVNVHDAAQKYYRVLPGQ